MNLKTSLPVFCLVLSCGGSSSPPPPAASKKAPAAAPVPKEITFDTRTPFDFSNAWAEIYTLKDEVEKRTRALSLIEKWEGRRYEWEGYTLFSLCQEDKKRCAVNVFERTRTASPDALGGFFPMLHFTDTGFASLRESCKGKTACIVRFRGVLKELRTDPDFPLGMTFTEVESISTRAPSPEEQWWKKGPSFELPEDYQVRPPPLANPNEPPLPPLKVKVVEKTF